MTTAREEVPERPHEHGREVDAEEDVARDVGAGGGEQHVEVVPAEEEGVREEQEPREDVDLAQQVLEAVVWVEEPCCIVVVVIVVVVVVVVIAVVLGFLLEDPP